MAEKFSLSPLRLEHLLQNCLCKPLGSPILPWASSPRAPKAHWRAEGLETLMAARTRSRGIPCKPSQPRDWHFCTSPSGHGMGVLSPWGDPGVILGWLWGSWVPWFPGVPLEGQELDLMISNPEHSVILCLWNEFTDNINWWSLQGRRTAPPL